MKYWAARLMQIRPYHIVAGPPAPALDDDDKALTDDPQHTHTLIGTSDICDYYRLQTLLRHADL